jgi:hypothetical protein
MSVALFIARLSLPRFVPDNSRLAQEGTGLPVAGNFPAGIVERPPQYPLAARADVPVAVKLF